MATAYINIGSNIGDRMAHLERAVAAVEGALGSPARRSPVVESAPWGFDSPNRFLNIGLAVDTPLPPAEILGRLLAAQRSVDSSAHRDAEGRYVDRAIDIDLIAVDETVVDTPALTLPHPRMHERAFVLEPMAFLAPSWRHPLLGETAAALLARLGV